MSLFDSLRDVCNDGDPEEVFELIEQIGKGSYGNVYKAIDKPTGEVVALKVLELEEDEEMIEEVTKEIAILTQCKHKNVVNHLGSYIKDNQLWISMEYCGGGSVSEVCELLEEGWREDQIKFVMKESLTGLMYLHSLKKIHRDIKGSNILLTEQGDVKIADFGVSAQLQNTLSKRNTFVGTPYWMSPEVIQTEKYDDRADIWSLAVTAIEMAETVPPNSDIHPMKVLFYIPTHPPPTLETPEDFSDEFNNFLEYCLVKDAAARPHAKEALEHPFLANTKGNAVMVDMIDRAAQVERVSDSEEDSSDESSDEESDDDDVGDGRGTMKRPKTEDESDNTGTIEIKNDNSTLEPAFLKEHRDLTSASMHFVVTVKESANSEFYITGNVPELGESDLSKAIKMEKISPSRFEALVSIKQNDNLEYKYASSIEGGEIKLEDGVFRRIKFGGFAFNSKEMQIHDIWQSDGEFAPHNVPQIIDFESLPQIQTKHVVVQLQINSSLLNLTPTQSIRCVGTFSGPGLFELKKVDNDWWVGAFVVSSNSIPLDYKYLIYDSKDRSLVFESSLSRTLQNPKRKEQFEGSVIISVDRVFQISH